MALPEGNAAKLLEVPEPEPVLEAVVVVLLGMRNPPTKVRGGAAAVVALVERTTPTAAEAP